jgi:ABC-type transporter Mla subunit MlaD
MLDEGKPRFDDADAVRWNATNQFTKQTKTIELPKMKVGSTWLGQVRDSETDAPVVDEVQALVGGTCTIFQRMNDAGDLLRVCTNVITTDGDRAIGTYIPARNPDGTPNEVVRTVLSGETFYGRAYVVNGWYQTAYEPIRGDDGEVVGVLYVGVRQDSVASVRESILKTTVGKSGYVFVLGGTGGHKGHYIISKDGARDGENILGATDPDGRYVIREMIEQSMAADDGEVVFYRYPWLNEGETKSRHKIAALSYFEPWDWVIGASCYEDDFAEERELVGAQLASLTWWSSGAAMVVAIIGGLLAWLAASKVGRILGSVTSGLDAVSGEISSAAAQLSSASQSLADATSSQAAALEETSASLEEITSITDQTAENAERANGMSESAYAASAQGDQTVGRLDQSMRGISDSSEKVTKIIRVIEDIAFQTNLLALNAAIEAQDAGAAGTRFAVVAEEVRRLAQRADEAAKETASLIAESAGQVKVGAEVSQQVGGALRAIGTDVSGVTELLRGIAQAAREQAEGVKQITSAVGQVDAATQQSAANAEETAASAQMLTDQARDVRQSVNALMAVVDGRARPSKDADDEGASAPSSMN